MPVIDRHRNSRFDALFYFRDISNINGETIFTPQISTTDHALAN